MDVLNEDDNQPHLSAADAFRLDGEVALITGGGSGLGLAMARCLAEVGAKVVVSGRREDVLAEAVGFIGRGAGHVVHDVTDFKSAPKLVDAVEKHAGAPPSILINNAGNHLKKWAVETSEEEFQSVMDTHVMGAFALTKAAAPAMIQRKHGSIIFIASMASLMGVPQIIAYTTAKSACVGMVRGFAAEFSPHNVRVNAIVPGWIGSDMLRSALKGDPARADRVMQRTPMRRLGTPDDIGYAAVYLCSQAARFVTGALLPVDGGASTGF